MRLSLQTLPVIAGLLLVLLTSLSTSCKRDDHVVPPECDTLVVSYSQDIVPILALYCNDPNFGDCHDASVSNARGNFVGYEGVKAKVDNGTLLSRTIIRKDMPRSTTDGPRVVSAEHLLLLDCWIDDGAPEN